MSEELNIGLQFFAGPEPPAPPGAHIYIYSNDGAELLGTVNSDTFETSFLTLQLFYNENYKCISNSFVGIPYGSYFDLTSYAGIADTPNAIEPTYADGYNFGNSGTYTVYVVPFLGYTLTYISEHGTTPEPVYHLTELTSSELPTLSAEGYSFKGWFYEDTFDTQAQIGDVIEEDTTLYAKWDAIIGIVNFGTLTDALTVTANAIRAKTGGTANLTFDMDGGTGFEGAIENSGLVKPSGTITLTKQSGTDVSTKATASVRSGSLSLNTPSVSATGVVTASAFLSSSGWIGSAPSSKTLQLTIQAGKIVTPSTSRQTAVASGRYTTGTVDVAGDANLVASNIKRDVNIFGVTGTYEGSSGTLIEKSITQNGTYNASADNADGYSQVTVAIPTYDGTVV